MGLTFEVELYSLVLDRALDKGLVSGESEELWVALVSLELEATRGLTCFRALGA